jgi:hypothetical protein
MRRKKNRKTEINGRQEINRINLYPSGMRLAYKMDEAINKLGIIVNKTAQPVLPLSCQRLVWPAIVTHRLMAMAVKDITDE